ncbi:hypothetical protein MRX96_025407 [Rhipicephalus microplus]
MTPEVAAPMSGDLAARTQVFFDGFVLWEFSSTAACIVPHFDTERQCPLLYCAFSTTAELFSLLLAADLLHESKPALSKLARSKHGPLLGQRAARSLFALQKHGCDIVLEWLPSLAGITGNESADKLD